MAIVPRARSSRQRVAAQDCINCSGDCFPNPPCGCGDGYCAGDQVREQLALLLRSVWLAHNGSVSFVVHGTMRSRVAQEALGCVDDCFVCDVKYLKTDTDIKTGKMVQYWARRPDRVAAYYTFDDVNNVGKDNSANGLDMQVTNRDAFTTTGCAPPTGRQKFDTDVQGCVLTSLGAPLYLKDIRKAYGRLPVFSCSVTIALFAKVTKYIDVASPSFLIRWGDERPSRSGLSNVVKLDFGSSGRDGRCVCVVSQARTAD